MKAKEALAKVHEFNATKIYNFKLTLCNEGQSMTYLETCRVNLENLLTRFSEIVSGLKAIFPTGDFSVLIENPAFDNHVFYNPEVGILDDNRDILLNLTISK